MPTTSSDAAGAATFADQREQTLASFDWQWGHLAAGDFMPGDPWFERHAGRVLSEELCAIRPEWFRGKEVLDAGCGQGRWTRVLLDLGANVTAVDFSDAGLARTRALAGDSARLTTRRVDLLELPPDVAARRFDLVYSFGVLHHTGDTWKALDNVAALVAEGGALFLYLYGVESWSPEETARIERLRRELASLPFDAKIAELKRRFPGDDPHQMFDLLSPVVNDRVRFDDVATRLVSLGFDRVERTLADGEVYLRATRPGFPADALLAPVADRGIYLPELHGRFAVRKGAAFEESLRAAVASVPARPLHPALAAAVKGARRGRVLDVSFPPDRLPASAADAPEARVHDGPSLARPESAGAEAVDAVVWLGASVGAGRHPEVMLARLMERVAPGGVLLVELPDAGFGVRRSALEKALDFRRDVPGKVAALLRRHGSWCVGEALHALGGDALVNPIARDRAERAVRVAGASTVEWLPGRQGTAILLAARDA